MSGSIAIDPAATLVFNGPNGGTVSGLISGSGTLIDDASTMALTGALSNTFSGATIVQQGTMTLHKSGSNVAIAGPLTVGAGGNPAEVVFGNSQQISPSVIVSFGNNTSSLRLNAFQQTVGGLTSNAGNGEVGNYGAGATTLIIAAVGSNTYGGELDDGLGGSFLGLLESGTGSQTITGPISFSGNVQVNSGLLTLTGTNTYTGNTVVEGGTLVAENNFSLPDGGNLIVGNETNLFSPVSPAGVAAGGSNTVAVPEPGTMALFAAGGAALAVVLRRRGAKRLARRRISRVIQLTEQSSTLGATF